MNKEQWSSLFRTIVQMVCAGLVSKGIVSAEQSADLLGNLEIIIPALVAVVFTVYGSIIKRSDANLVKAAKGAQLRTTGVADVRIR
jgi:hypothetical protein